MNCRNAITNDRGSTSVVAALITAAIVGLTLVALNASMRVAEYRHDGIVADLAAVAAAVTWQQGQLACDAAQLIAEANDRELQDCFTEGEDVIVTVGGATSRAGPKAP